MNDIIDNLFTISTFSRVMKKLYDKREISLKEKEYLLGCAMLLLEEYDKTEEKELFELAYNIVLRYSVSTNDYAPLFDFSCNYGFYPTVEFIANKRLLETFTFQDILSGYQMEQFRNEGYVETQEQNKTRLGIIDSQCKNIAFIAPTSSGKSSLIIQHLESHSDIEKAVVIVPSKALISQTYMDLRRNIHDRKIISHEGMYKEERRFVGALTQERLLRLLENNESLEIDCLYVDEAHNIFKNDDRNVLLGRAITLCKKRKPNMNVIFLSPFVNNVNNLMVGGVNEIDEQRISFNIKEPDIYVKNREGIVKIYDRFSNRLYSLDECGDALEYIKKHEKRKNFIFLNTPKKIEDFAELLYQNTDEVELSKDLVALQQLLAKVVHPYFNINRYLSHGILYLHGIIPNQIKEYLEYQFKTNDKIKYLIANVVIMEGINLPIDCLFVCNVHQMTSAALLNLVGRVNRLNHVFDSEQGNLAKLIPNIHFVDTPDFTAKNANMEKIVQRMYIEEKDEVRNPLLDNCSLDDLKPTKKEKMNERNKQILEQEEVYYSTPVGVLTSLKKQLIVSGMNQFIELSDESVARVLYNLRVCDLSQDIIDIVSYVFTTGVNVTDAEFRRLGKPEAVRFYKFFMNELKRGNLSSLILSQLEYQMNRRGSEPYMYVGPKYGEVSGWRDDLHEGKKVFVDVRTKTPEQLINLLIVKSKVEEDFIGFKYNRAVCFLHDNGLISEDRFNLEIYGTNDERKIQLLDLGIPMSLLNVLDTNNQISNISSDTYGNLMGNENLMHFRDEQDDFIKYQINKFFLF